MKRLVIDLGHGGYDPGAVGKNGTKESDIVLSIGRYLNDLLKDVDLEVIFTRISDKYISLSDRVKLSNSFKADYFLSIHVNSCSDESVRGVEMWQYSKEDRSLNEFSSGLCKDISDILKIRNRGVKLSKSLYVLRKTSMKATLLEVDFISNKDCESDLRNNDNIKAISRFIKKNILKLYDIDDNKNPLKKLPYK